MAKHEDSKLSKLKHFLGIGGTKGDSLNLDNVKPPTKEFIITNDILKDISPQCPLNSRIKRIRDLCETVLTRKLEDNAVEAIWQCTADLLRESVPTEDRHLMLRFLQCLIKGQYTHLGILRDHFFRVVKGHALFEDVALRLDLFKVLSCEGKDLEYFEEETGMFLLEWMRDIMSSNKVSDFLLLLINVIKFNAAYIDEEIISGLVMNTCLIATQTRLETEVELCLKVLDTVVCYSYLPSESLHQFIVCLCRIVNLEKFSQDTWTLMRKLLGTHLGHSGIYTMCCILQDKSNITESGASLIRGAVFFVGMALWGSKKVTSLKHPPSAVLPAFYQAVVHSESPKVTLEVVLTVNRLVHKYGQVQQMLTWDTILDIIEILLKRSSPSTAYSIPIQENMQTLLTNIESLHERGQFNGSPDRFFAILESCSYVKPETVLALVTHKAKAIHPCKDNWIYHLNELADRYFKDEKRTPIRVKVLDVIHEVYFTYKHLYEDELLEIVVLPYLSHIDEDVDCDVKKRAAQLLVDIVMGCLSEKCMDLLCTIRKIMNRPFVKSPSSRVADTGERPKQQPIDFQDILIAANGLINVFKSKLFHVPSSHALEIYDILVTHIKCHYNHSHIMLQTGNIRKQIFKCLLDLRADTLQRLGLPDKNGLLQYSPYVTCRRRPDAEGLVTLGALSGTTSPPLGVSSSNPCKPVVLHYSAVFCCVRKCMEEEIDWEVIREILDKMPHVLQNKSLILSAEAEDVERFCSRLCIMLSDKNVGFPEKLINAPAKFSKSDFHSFIFPTLTCLVAYNTYFDKSRQRDLLKCLEFGLVSRSARICVRALTVCSLEMQDVMLRQLPAVLLKLSQISATVSMAIPLMEFLSSLIHLPQLYSNFVEEQYMSIFAIALPYTNPFKYNHYTVSLAYHVISMWFLKCRMPFRRGFVGFIVKGLQSNVLRQFEDAAAMRIKQQNQDSSERARAQTIDAGLRSKARAAATKARAGVGPTTSVQDEGMSTFHKELTETCIDMLARYTFSTFSSLPKRSPVENFLLDGGQSQSWLLGNKIVTITTSGGAKVGRAGLCTKCLTMARAASAQTSKTDEPQPAPTAGRKRHRSAAATTKTEAVAIRPRSQDDIQLYRPESRESLGSSDGDRAALRRSGSLSSREDIRDGESSRLAPLDTRKDKIDAVDSVLLGLRANPTDRSIFSPQTCNCWCTLWAEIHIRRPTGNFSWMMRIQNEQDLNDFFPDFSLTDISNLLISAPDTCNVYDILSGNKIDSHSLEETEYESLLEEHFHGEGSFSSLNRKMLTNQHIPEEDENIIIASGEVKSMADFTNLSEGSNLKKSTSTPDLTPAQSQRLATGKSSNSDLQDVFSRSQDLSTAQPPQPSSIAEKSEPGAATGNKPDMKPASSAAESSKVSEDEPAEPKAPRPEAGSAETSPKSKNPAQAAPPGRAVPAETGTLEKKSISIGPGMGSGADVVQGGISPSFLFLQLYHAHMFGSEERPLLLPQTEVVTRATKLLDLIYPYETHKLGVIYVGPGQSTDQTAILSNAFGSPRYMDFVKGLGHLIRLRDCNPSSVFLGGLDQNGRDGLFTYAWHDEFIQVIYHVATLMPNKESDPNANAKKLHIGNDYVTIVYNDSLENYKIGVIKGQFNYVNVIITPLDHGMNAVTVQTKDDIEELIGHTDTKIISDSNLAVLVRQMAVHANLASTILQKQKSNPKDPYASNWLERLRQVKRLRSKVLSETQSSSHPSSPIPEDFTDFV